ncbi:hypothetical protein [Sphaerisporangium fuscum]|uniref:hypothetical protein n=1 Tax=Sphaerisporangium fuscum TaxID=2835868 RepID=UPI001BDDC7D1|nr:hypothetical protein [Sphaerisporangium fuscum]
MEDLPEWMQEFRRPQASWTPPDGLKGPTPFPPLNLALTMLSASSIIGNDLAELVGLWIAAMARMNMWLKAPGRRPLDKGEYPRLLVLQGNVAGRIYDFWQVYMRAAGDASTEHGEREYQALLDAVHDGVKEIQAVMER